MFIDSAGRVMAKVIWWRDGAPVDVEDDVIWGEGVYVSVTPDGRGQIEARTGSLAVMVNARRELSPE